MRRPFPFVKFRVVVVGRPRDSHLSSLIADYESRATRYWPLEAIEVRGELGTVDSTLVREREGRRLLERIEQGDVVACHETGDRMDSAAFSEWMQRCRERATDVNFVIGGAFGLSPAVLERSSRRLSLAPWTLPHELARLVLAEQLYRAGTLVRREPYHK